MLTVELRTLATRDFRQAWQALMMQPMPYAAAQALLEVEKTLNYELQKIQEFVAGLKGASDEDATNAVEGFLDMADPITLPDVKIHADKRIVLTPAQYKILSSVIIWK